MASKSFSKMLPMTNFRSEQFWILSLTSPENGYSFVTQKFAKMWKISFRIFVFGLKATSKPSSKMFHLTNFTFKHFWTLYLASLENGLNFVTAILKNKKCHFQMLRTFVFDLSVAWKPFSEMLLLSNFSSKRFQLRHLNNFCKIEKHQF